MDKMTVYPTTNEHYYFRSIRRWGHHTLILIARDRVFSAILFETPNAKTFEAVRNWLVLFDVDTLLMIAAQREKRGLS